MVLTRDPALTELCSLPNTLPRSSAGASALANALDASTTPPNSPCNNLTSTNCNGVVHNAIKNKHTAKPSNALNTIHFRLILSPSFPISAKLSSSLQLEQQSLYHSTTVFLRLIDFVVMPYKLAIMAQVLSVQQSL